jgi:hypothetical protein
MVCPPWDCQCTPPPPRRTICALHDPLRPRPRPRPRQLYNKAFSKYVPAAMVLPSSPGDVVTALNIVLAYNETIAVRSASGHSYIAQSTVNNGLVLCLEVGFNT